MTQLARGVTVSNSSHSRYRSISLLLQRAARVCQLQTIHCTHTSVDVSIQMEPVSSADTQRCESKSFDPASRGQTELTKYIGIYDVLTF